MKVEIKVPDPGEDGPKEASISFWMFEAGDEVSEGEDLVELVTDKASYTVSAPSDGRLTEIRAGEGDTVTPNQVLAVMETDE
jgi:pyruvate dehydrogenase E2 component (dihydrolipoamide acetyltransferase)